MSTWVLNKQIDFVSQVHFLGDALWEVGGNTVRFFEKWSLSWYAKTCKNLVTRNVWDDL